MSLELSAYDMERLHVTWLASKDINSQEFQRKIKCLWAQSKKEIQDILKKCDFSINLQDSKILGFMLGPNHTIAFNPEKNAYLINLFFFLFSNDTQEACIKPSWYLVPSFVHEYDHYEFCRDNDMLFQDSETTRQFIIKYWKEIENRAYSEEDKFLKKAESLAPKLVNKNFFSVKAWPKNGIPSCKVINRQISIDTWMFMEQMNCKALRRKVNSHSKSNYENIMSKNKKSFYTDLSRVLKLNSPTDSCPIVEITL